MKSIVAEDGKHNESSDYIVYATSLPFGEANHRNEAINSIAVIEKPRENPEAASENRDE